MVASGTIWRHLVLLAFVAPLVTYSRGVYCRHLSCILSATVIVLHFVGTYLCVAFCRRLVLSNMLSALRIVGT